MQIIAGSLKKANVSSIYQETKGLHKFKKLAGIPAAFDSLLFMTA